MLYKKTNIHLSSLLMISSCLLLTACYDTGQNQVSGPVNAVSGTVMHGSSPISGSAITLYEATSTAPVILAKTESQSNGTFRLTYNTPPLGSYIYLVANGGNNNSNINLVNILGTGTTIATTATMNEMTTVASYQAFTTDWNTAADIPTLMQTGDNNAGMAIGFATYQNIVNPTTGGFSNHYPITTSTGEQLAVQANVLALCVQNSENCSILKGSNYLNTDKTDTFSLMRALKTANSNAIANINTLLQANSTSLPYPRTNLVQNALAINYSSTFDWPSGQVADAMGNIWIVNKDNNTVVELQKNQNGSYNTALFSGLVYDFHYPDAITRDKQGHIWVVNLTGGNDGLGSVTEMDQNGNFMHTFSNQQNPAYRFNFPYAITSDSNGNIWVVNSSGENDETGSVTEMNSNGELINNFSNQQNPNYHFDFPEAITADPHDNIWVVNQSGNSVTEMDQNGNLINNFSGANYRFSEPQAIESDNQGNIWVVNLSGGNDELGSITEMNQSGQFINNFSNRNNPLYQLHSPYAINIDHNGNIWITNLSGNSVTEIDPNGHFMNNFSSVEYQFNNPQAITSDNQGNIWVANHTGNSMTEIKNDNNHSPQIFAGVNYGFNYPADIISDSQGNLWVANLIGNSVTQIGNNGDLKSFLDQPVYNFNSPSAITSDDNGNIWVSNKAGSITKLDESGQFISNFTDAQNPNYNFNFPSAITADHQGHIWVVNHTGGHDGLGSITEMNLNGDFINNLSNQQNPDYHFNAPQAISSDNQGHLWIVNQSGNSITETDSDGHFLGHFSNQQNPEYHFNSPAAMTIDSKGNLWIANQSGAIDGLGSITEMDCDGHFVNNFTNQQNSNYHFNFPETLTHDAQDNLWIVNRSGNSITEIDHSGNFKNLLTQQSYGFNRPAGITSDSNGNIWVVDIYGKGLTEIIN